MSPAASTSHGRSSSPAGRRAWPMRMRWVALAPGRGWGNPGSQKSNGVLLLFQGDLRISGLRWFKVWPKSTCAPEFGRNNDVIHTLIHHLPPYPPLPTSSHHYHHYHPFPCLDRPKWLKKNAKLGSPDSSRCLIIFNIRTIIYLYHHLFKVVPHS